MHPLPAHKISIVCFRCHLLFTARHSQNTCEGFRPEWYISTMEYSRDIPFCSETLTCSYCSLHQHPATSYVCYSGRLLVYIYIHLQSASVTGTFTHTLAHQQQKQHVTATHTHIHCTMCIWDWQSHRYFQANAVCTLCISHQHKALSAIHSHTLT